MRPLSDGHDRTSLSFQSPESNVVTSRQNPFIERLRDIRDKKPGDLLFLEGPKLLEEALKSNLTIEHLVFVPDILSTELIQTALPIARNKTQINAYVLKGLADVEAPQGVITIARRPQWTWDMVQTAGVRSKNAPSWCKNGPDPSRAPLFVVLDGIQNAGNAATIVRTAEAAGVAGVITTPKTAHLFSPKALRGAMGSSLRLPILEHQPVPVILDKFAAAQIDVLTSAAPSAASVSYTELDWKKSWAIVVGQEGNGLSADWLGKTQGAVHIPMAASVESLNVAAAAAIFLYEARRQNSVRS